MRFKKQRNHVDCGPLVIKNIGIFYGHKENTDRLPRSETGATYEIDLLKWLMKRSYILKKVEPKKIDAELAKGRCVLIDYMSERDSEGDENGWHFALITGTRKNSFFVQNLYLPRGRKYGHVWIKKTLLFKMLSLRDENHSSCISVAGKIF